MLRASTTLLGLLLCAANGCKSRSADTASPDLPQPDRNVAVELDGLHKTFDNGLTLFVLPDRFTRLVQYDMRQQVGSREDPAGKEGMAHFVEHLMFMMPAEGEGSPKLMSHIPQHTLFFNAYTAADQTHYIHTGTADNLETYMKYTALRLNHACDSVSEAEFMRERDVVRNEHRLRGQGFDLKIFETISQVLFPDGHPYGRSPLAGDEAVASISQEDACTFIQRYYTPSQASVVISGDVDPLEVLELAKTYLEPLPKREVPPRAKVPPAALEPGTIEVKAPVKKPTAIVLFGLPHRFSPDFIRAQASLETLIMSLAYFVNREGPIVKRWYPTILGGRDAQIFGIAVETDKARDLNRAINEVMSAINRGFASEVKGEEKRGTYDSVRQRSRLEVLSNVASVMNRGDTFADYLERGIDTGFVGADLQVLDALTSEEAHALGRKLFSTNRAMVVKVVPEGSPEDAKGERASFTYKPQSEENLSVPEDIDPAEAKRPLAIQDITPPEGEWLEFTLENGMDVVLVKSSQIPVMDIQLIVRGGTLEGGPGGALARVAQSGYGPMYDRDSRSYENYFDMAGGIFNAWTGPHASTYTTRGLSVYLDFLIAGLADRIVNGEYQTSALEHWKQRTRDNLKKASVQSEVEREQAFMGALFGEEHPFQQQVLAHKDQLKSVNLRGIEQFRQRQYRGGNATLIITGNFDLELVPRYIEAFFGAPKIRTRNSRWNDAPERSQSVVIPPPKPGDVRTLTQVDPDKVMTDITIAYPIAEVFGPNHAALLVLQDMLNFRAGAVRQQLGASYGIYAGLDTGKPHMRIGGAVDGKRSNEGYRAILAAIHEVRDGEGDAFDQLFAFSRRNVLRQMVSDQADPKLLAGRLAQAIQYGVSYDYFQDLARQVATLEPAKVRAVIGTVLDDRSSVTLLSGPAAGIADIVEGSGLSSVRKLSDAVSSDDDD